MIRVAFFSWSQADWGLLEPIVTGLAESEAVSVLVYPFTEEHRKHISARTPSNVTVVQPEFEELLITQPMATMFGSVTGVIDMELREQLQDIDHAVVLGDRLPEVAVATVCTTRHIPVHHLFAGDRSGTLDDRYRDVITMMSSNVYTFSKPAFIRAHGVRSIAGDHFQVSAVHMPDVELDDSFVKQLSERGITDYMVVRLHPDTETQEPIEKWIDHVLKFSVKTGSHILWLPPNQDDGWHRITSRWQEAEEEHEQITQMPVLPRAQYLAVLANSGIIIGNSSSFVHDAPLVGMTDKTQLVGDRQHKRTAMNPEHGKCVVQALLENIHAPAESHNE